ncbi:hypothetical protein ACV56Z_11335 [Staphylococcus aureus]
MMQLLVKRDSFDEKKLQHEDGYRVTIVDDNSNTIAHTLIEKKKKDGKDIQLTIDAKVQRV